MVEKDGVRALYLGEQTGVIFDRFPNLVLKKFTQLHSENPFHLVHSLDASGLEIGLQRKQLGVAVVYDVDATNMSRVYGTLGMSQESFRAVRSVVARQLAGARARARVSFEFASR